MVVGDWRLATGDWRNDGLVDAEWYKGDGLHPPTAFGVCSSGRDKVHLCTRLGWGCVAMTGCAKKKKKKNRQGPLKRREAACAGFRKGCPDLRCNGCARNGNAKWNRRGFD